MTDLCEHGDIPAACLDCLHEKPAGPDPDRPKPPVVLSRFPARYPGQCPGCDLPIVPNQEIVAMSNGTYLHRGCV